MTKIFRMRTIAEFVTFNPDTGEFPDKTGTDRKRKKSNGYWYVRIRHNKKTFEVLAHHLIHYLAFDTFRDNIPLLRGKDEMSVANSSYGAGESSLNPVSFKHYSELKDLKEKQTRMVIRKTIPIIPEKVTKFYVLEKDIAGIEAYLDHFKILNAKSRKGLSEKYYHSGPMQ